MFNFIIIINFIYLFIIILKNNEIIIKIISGTGRRRSVQIKNLVKYIIFFVIKKNIIHEKFIIMKII